MNLHGEPLYRIQKNCFEGFLCAMIQNFRKHKEVKIMMKHYQKVQEIIDIQYPQRQRRKRDEMKPVIWKWFFDGLMDKPRLFKVQPCISRKRTLFWRSFTENKDYTTQQNIRILGLTCRRVIEDMGEEKLFMFDEIFYQISEGKF